MLISIVAFISHKGESGQRDLFAWNHRILWQNQNLERGSMLWLKPTYPRAGIARILRGAFGH